MPEDAKKNVETCYHIVRGIKIQKVGVLLYNTCHVVCLPTFAGISEEYHIEKVKRADLFIFLIRILEEWEGKGFIFAKSGLM